MKGARVPDHEITLGEVGRRLGEVLVELREMHRDLIGRAEYEADQKGVDRRFEESGKVHVQLEARVAEVNAARKVAVTEEATEREKADERLETRLDRIGGWVKYGVTTALGLLTAAVGWVIATGGIGGGS
jgi:hypothetical protein